MKEKYRCSVGSKLTLMIILMALILSGATIFVGYQTYRQKLVDLYVEQGRRVAATAGEMVNWDKVNAYLETGETDRQYDDVLSSLRIIARNNGDVAYLFALRPAPEGTVYIYDTDETESQAHLGQLIPWYAEFLPVSRDMLEGREIEPIVSDGEFGWLLSVYLPWRDGLGQFAGYIGVDFSMENIRRAQTEYLGSLVLVTAGISTAIALLFLWVIRRYVVRPINRMGQAADNYLVQAPGGESDASSFSQLDIMTRDELQSLAESLKAMESKLHQYIHNLGVATERAETDSLTGLMNREAFQQRVTAYLKGEPSKEKLHAFLMVDIDLFKNVNDTLGHVRGDEVLQATAKILQRQFRSSDFVARIGGDEFAIFCKEAGSPAVMAQKAAAMGGEMRSMALDEEGTHATLSMGIALFPQDGEGYEALYHSADKALYKAKAAGRDRCAFSSQT